MQRQPVASSNVASVGYALEGSILEVGFHSGTAYQYYGVPQSVYAAFMSASSKGRYHARFIKDRYRFRRVV
ncbi:KTSC domain-containing protein [Streptomyces pluripotens]|uniref:KTSC domain-containing protein n=1 Tax=Streptomyces pluripotens TaxID=1355015 RepID=A0A221NUB8_9ACTN|nr:KTSC domain-containing protein [Streptomyces pluripotens]ARP69309.1 KTSC domain-containing protein [Streptomyces pluripotens]ASN23567.1 KTSC domain-containing protein [Streptomyces pluripotens]